MDDEILAEVVADIRRRLAARGEPDDFSDDELRQAACIAILQLALEHSEGGEERPPDAYSP